MNEFLREINASILYHWFLSQKIEGITIQESKPLELQLDTEYARGHIVMHEMGIYELSVDNLINGDCDFYLHFQITTFNHAIELFHEMVECILGISKKPVLKVLLSCSSGLTTSLYASMLEEAAKEANLNFEFNAVAFTELIEAAKDYNMILLAPQIAYNYPKVKEMMKNKTVLKIPPQIFAKYDAQKGLQFIQEEIDKTNNGFRETKVFDISLEKHDGKVLTLGLINSQSLNIMRLLARIYDENNEILETKESRRKEITMKDILDIVDTMLAIHNDVTIISLAIPGIINNGKTKWNSGFNNIPIQKELENRFHRRVSIWNDLNAVAAGYYLYDKKVRNLAYIYQPVQANAGIGIIHDGKLITGHMNIAGEVKFVPFNLSDDWKKLAGTEAGTLEIMGKVVATTIAMGGPDLIVYYSELIPDVEDLVLEVQKYIPQEYLPQIRKSHHLSDYICAGALFLGLEEAKK